MFFEGFQDGFVIRLEFLVVLFVGHSGGFRIIEDFFLLGYGHGLGLLEGFIGFLDAIIGLLVIVGLGLEIAGVVSDFGIGVGGKTALGGGRLSCLSVAFQISHQLAVGGIEEPGVFAGEYQRNAGAIRANGHGADRAARTDLAYHFKAIGVPMPNSAVIGAGNKLRRRSGHGRQRGDRAGMALEFTGHL